MSECGGTWREQVTFEASVRVLFWKTVSRTRVNQEVDVRNDRHARVTFGLQSSVRMDWALPAQHPARR